MRGNGDAHRIASQQGAFDAVAQFAGVTGVLLRDDEVEGSGLQLEERLLGRDLDHVHTDVRMLGPERRQGAGDDGLGDGRHDGDAHDLRGVLSRRQLGAHGLVEFERPGRMLGEQAPLRGQTYAPTVGFEQRSTRLAFEQGELLRHRRGAVRQGCGDLGDGAAQRQLVQEAQTSELEHRAPRYLREHRTISIVNARFSRMVECLHTETRTRGDAALWSEEDR